MGFGTAFAYPCSEIAVAHGPLRLRGSGMFGMWDRGAWDEMRGGWDRVGWDIWSGIEARRGREEEKTKERREKEKRWDYHKGIVST